MKLRWLAFKKRFWDSRALSERRAISLGGLLLSPLLAYFVLWQPAHVALKRLSVSVETERLQAARMHTQETEISSLRHLPQPAVLDANALKTAVEQSALRHQLREALSSIETQQPNAVRLTFTAVSFESWLNWLRSLQQEQHIRAVSVGIAVMPQVGMVRINATLSNGAIE